MDGRRRRERGERKRGRSGRETGKLPSLFLPLPLRRLANSPFPPFPLLSRESRRGGEKEREPEKGKKGEFQCKCEREREPMHRAKEEEERAERSSGKSSFPFTPPSRLPPTTGSGNVSCKSGGGIFEEATKTKEEGRMG